MVPDSSIFRGVLSIVEKEINEMFSAWGAGGKRSHLIRVKEYFFLESGKPARSRNLSMQMTRAIRHLWNLSV